MPGTAEPGAAAAARCRRTAPATRLGPIWMLLVVNTWGFVGVALIVPVPRQAGQMVTMGCLVAAFALVLLRNPRLEIRPSLVLALLTVAAVVALASSLRLEAGTGGVFRAVRLLLFLATLWLSTPWWADPLQLVRCHIRGLGATLLLVLAGLAVAPGKAMSGPPDGRLQGTFWPMQPPAVGQFAAVLAGLTVTLWIGRIISTRQTACVVPGALMVLLATHTRTPIAGLVVGLLAAAGSLVLTNSRARRCIVRGVAGLCAAALLLGPFIVGWLARGQDTEELTSLTGRQTVWSALLSQPRDFPDRVLGTGLSNKSYTGLPIDNAWLTVYHEQGYVGVAGVAAVLLAVVLTAVTRPPSPERACAVFLVAYVLVASYTEVGLGDACPYLLHITVAVALLSRPSPALREGAPS